MNSLCRSASNNRQRSTPTDGLYRARIVSITNLLERSHDGDSLVEVAFELQVEDEPIHLTELYSDTNRYSTGWQNDLYTLLDRFRPNHSELIFGTELDYEVLLDASGYVSIHHNQIVSVHSEVEIESLQEKSN